MSGCSTCRFRVQAEITDLNPCLGCLDTDTGVFTHYRTDEAEPAEGLCLDCEPARLCDAVGVAPCAGFDSTWREP